MRRILILSLAFACSDHASASGDIAQQAQRQQLQLLQQSGLRVAPPTHSIEPYAVMHDRVHSDLNGPAFRGAAAIAPVASDALGAAYTYDGVGNRESAVYPNGIVAHYKYDRRDRLIEMRTSRDDVPIFRQNYTLDASGLRIRVDSIEADGSVRVTDYSYDFVKRLTGEIQTRNGIEELHAAYEYDRSGNRTKATVNGVTTTYVYDANDRLESETSNAGAASGTISYSYDEGGNRIEKSGPMGRVRYVYDDAGRMVEARSAGDVVMYKYAHDGLMLEKTWSPNGGPATTWRYLWDTSRSYPEAVEEWSDEGSGVFHDSAKYVFGDDLVSQSRNGVTSYALLDGFGDARALADANGQVSDTFAFDAWGNILSRSGDTVDHLYRGEWFDPNIGYYNLRARWMDPAVGRFTQMDKFDGFSADPVSLHKYVYANSDPTNRIDPSGYNSNLLSSAVAVGIVAVLATGAMIAMNQTRGSSATADRKFSVWDAVAVSQYRPAANNQALNQTSIVVGAIATAAVSRHGHHTIPKYMCGGRVQPLADVTEARHKLIHAGIAGIRIALAGAEEYATKSTGIGRRRNGDVVMLAQTHEGRQAIAAGLRSFYYYGGFWNDGELRTIGSAFTEEEPRYTSGANTTLPWCSEDGEP